jgi:hypothetical protein
MGNGFDFVDEGPGNDVYYRQGRNDLMHFFLEATGDDIRFGGHVLDALQVEIHPIVVDLAADWQRQQQRAHRMGG